MPRISPSRLQEGDAQAQRSAGEEGGGAQTSLVTLAPLRHSAQAGIQDAGISDRTRSREHCRVDSDQDLARPQLAT